VIAGLSAQLERLPNSAKPADLIPYKIVRSQKLTLKGQRTTFSLFRDGALLLFSKIKARSTTEIAHILRAEEAFHFSNESFDAALLAGNSFRTFSLRLQNQFGAELIILRFDYPAQPGAPRAVQALLFGHPPEIPSELVSGAPSPTIDGWSIPLNGRIGKRSIKNCVLVEPRGSREFLSLVKTKKSEFVVESHPALSELCVFALGISSCLCKM
jgi:hypothetical protein